jgi:hypothetical protein
VGDRRVGGLVKKDGEDGRNFEWLHAILHLWAGKRKGGRKSVICCMSCMSARDGWAYKAF